MSFKTKILGVLHEKWKIPSETLAGDHPLIYYAKYFLNIYTFLKAQTRILE